MSDPQRPLRILLSAYACEPGRGSEPGVGWNWAVELARSGHLVWVLTRVNNRERIVDGLKQLPQALKERLNFIYHDPPRWLTWWKKGGRGVQLFYAIWQWSALTPARSAHRFHRFDLVHHITFGVWRQPSRLYRLGIPFVFGPVGGGESAPTGLRQTLPWRARWAERLRDTVNWVSLFNPALRACLHRSAWVLAKTPETVDWLRRAGAARVDQHLEIGFDASQANPRTGLRLAGTPLRCLFAGRLLGWKGAHLAIAAVAHARRLGADVRLTVVGQGPMEAHLQRQVTAEGLESVVQFAGWMPQSELFDAYRNHDLLLFPSLHDSSGNVVLEGMAHGLPVVCLRCGGPAMMVDGSNGIAVDPAGLDQEAVTTAMAKKLAELAWDVDGWSRLSTGALAFARHATWGSTVGDCYEKVSVKFSST